MRIRIGCAACPIATRKTHRYLVFLTNRFDLPALAIAEIYRNRGQTELFFIWKYPDSD